MTESTNKHGRYVSDRNIELLCQSPNEKPTLTAEAYCKWYTLYLLNPDGSVARVANDLIDEYMPAGCWHIDHCYHGKVFDVLCEQMDWYKDELAQEVAMGRFAIEINDAC